VTNRERTLAVSNGIGLSAAVEVADFMAHRAGFSM